jgi:hypothetical protein
MYLLGEMTMAKQSKINCAQAMTILVIVVVHQIQKANIVFICS